MHHETSSKEQPRQLELPLAGRELDWGRLLQLALDTPGHLSDVYNRFYDYSYLNQLLLRAQGAAEPVATYKRWQRLGRQVMRGSTAYSVVRPIVIETKNEDGELPEKRLRFKPVKCLFGVSQTEGEPLPEVAPRGWDLSAALATLGIRRVAYRNLSGNMQGYSSGREYAINPVAGDPLKTTFHELGHIVLGHTDPHTYAEYLLHRGLTEFQAEATAYLTLNELDQLSAESAAHSRAYIQDWLAGERPHARAVRQVFSATDILLRAGRAALDSLNGDPDV